MTAVAAVTTSIARPVTAVAAPASTPLRPATLGEYWAGTADWKLAFSYPKATYELLPGDGGFGAGSLFDIGADGTWYWFYRTIANGDNGCSVFPSTGTMVRKSTDHGRSWTPPARVILATAGTPWACDGTDGDAHWDGSQWVYLFQCRADPAVPSPWGGRWNVCLFRNPSPDPTQGTWAPVVDHPVMGVYPGSYNPFAAICDQPTDDCARLAGGPGRVDEAGTPSIFDVPSEPGWHFVDIHGVDTQGLQYQAIVKTRDFVTYAATGTNLPGDAIFDREDATGWRETNPGWTDRQIGGGGGAVHRDPNDGMYYNLNEASDGPGGCYSASSFDLGILRATSPAQTRWSQPTIAGRENPIQYSQQLGLSDEQYAFRCSPSYSGIFYDPVLRETYMSFYRRSSDGLQAVYVFKLERNLLANGDAWRCIDAAPWRLDDAAAPASSFAIWRDGSWASDGSCYFALNRDVRQDVTIRKGSMAAVTWGGKLAARLSAVTPPMGYLSLPSTGTAKLVLTQHSATGKLLTTSSLDVVLPLAGAAPATYTSASTRTLIHPTATTLRYTVRTNGGLGLTLLADELFARAS